MRITAGFLKNRLIKLPKNSHIRPTTDKVRSAIFSILSDKIIDATVIDLFCGTGSLGIEAISRGAKFCQFVDEYCNLVLSNVKLLDKSTYNITRGNFFNVFNSLIKLADIIFIDPPYGKYNNNQILYCIAKAGLIKYNGIIVYEESCKYVFTLANKDFSLLKTKNYGDTNIYILEANVGNNLSGDI